jgi:hypothetical protein
VGDQVRVKSEPSMEQAWLAKYELSMIQVQVFSKPLDFSVNLVFPQYNPSTAQVPAQYTTWAILGSAQYTTWAILGSYLAISSSYSN